MRDCLVRVPYCRKGAAGAPGYLALAIGTLALLIPWSGHAESRPLWELGLGPGVARLSDYPGSASYRTYVLPFPYIRYRGKFLGEVPLFNATLTFNDVSAESLLDAQIGYNFESGTLKGLSISISGTNLTDEPFVLNNTGDDPYNVIKYENYGAVYALALSYSF